MKKLYLLLLLIPFFIACSDKDEPSPSVDPPKEVAQDHTSVVFVYTKEKSYKFKKCVLGYYDAYGYCLKIADLGEMAQDELYFKEVRVNMDPLPSVYLFLQYEDDTGSAVAPKRIIEPFILKKNYKNVINFTDKKTQSASGTGPADWPR